MAVADRQHVQNVAVFRILFQQGFGCFLRLRVLPRSKLSNLEHPDSTGVRVGVLTARSISSPDNPGILAIISIGYRRVWVGSPIQATGSRRVEPPARSDGPQEPPPHNVVRRCIQIGCRSVDRVSKSTFLQEQL
jgi:hypothetical protein